MAITFVQADGSRAVVAATRGDSVMETAVANGVAGILAECGGNLICGTCHVFLDQADMGRFPPPGGLEESLLKAAATPRRTTSRLSCQLLVDGADLVVHLPGEQ